MYIRMLIDSLLATVQNCRIAKLWCTVTIEDTRNENYWTATCTDINKSHKYNIIQKKQDTEDVQNDPLYMKFQNRQNLYCSGVHK